jgi:hypothetical protein
MAFTDIFSVLTEILDQLISKFIALIPDLIMALIILIVGYIVGRLVGAGVNIFLTKIIGLDKWLERKKLDKAAYGISISGFISGIAKWYIYIVFIGAAISHLDIALLTPFMQDVVTYFPRLIAGAVVLLIGLIAGEWIKRKVIETEILFREVIGDFMKIVIIAIFIVMSLSTMMIDATPLLWFIAIIVAGIILTLSIAIGIGVGLALKDEIKPLIKKLVEQLSEGKKDKED